MTQDIILSIVDVCIVASLLGAFVSLYLMAV